jgi:hypothetical protein
MFGGGFYEDYHLRELGIVDDSGWDVSIGSYLGGAGPVVFGPDNWGEEGKDADEKWSTGRVKGIWSGIIGFSADLIPWVGRVPPKLTGRPEPTASLPTLSHRDTYRARLGAPEEWIAAGYSGEGMVHAWLSGKAVGLMVLGKEQEGNVWEWLPACMRVGVQRWKKANLGDLLVDVRNCERL